MATMVVRKTGQDPLRWIQWLYVCDLRLSGDLPVGVVAEVASALVVKSDRVLEVGTVCELSLTADVPAEVVTEVARALVGETRQNACRGAVRTVTLPHRRRLTSVSVSRNWQQ